MITMSINFVVSSEKNIPIFNSDVNLFDNINYDSLDQQQNYDSGWGWSVYGSNAKMAQSFIPALSSLTKVELKIYKKGNPLGLTISIRNSLNGLDLTSVYKSSNLISTSANWFEFNFPDISVTPGITYYIIWYPNGVNSSDNFYWRLGDGDPYSNGNAWMWTGTNWEVHNPVEVPDPDFCFRTYGGVVGNNPPNIPNQPSGPVSGFVGESYSYSTSTIDPDGDDIKYGWDWDGDSIVDEYSNLINSGNMDSRSHVWNYPGTYNMKVKAQDENGALSGFSSYLSVTIYAENNPPDKPDTPSGATNGKTGTSYSYSTSTIDPEGHDVYYLFDWGDGSNSGWFGPYNSGEIINLSHSWSNDGTYPLKVKSKDIYDQESPWSDPLEVIMPKSKKSSIYTNSDFFAEIGLDGHRDSFANLIGKIRNRGRYHIINGLLENDDRENRFKALFRGNFFILQIPINNKIINIYGRVRFNPDYKEFDGLWRSRNNRLEGWIKGNFI
jgi:hypothetical protein